MQDLFNLINIRQMYSQEGKLSIVDKLDKLIGIILEQMTTIAEVPVTDPVHVAVDTKPVVVDKTAEQPSVSVETKSTVPNVFV